MSNRIFNKLNGTYFNKEGFTLLELILVLGLIGIVFVAGFQFLFIGYKNWDRTMVQADVFSEAQLFQVRFAKEVRQAVDAKIEQVSGKDVLRLYTYAYGEDIEKRISYRIEENDGNKSLERSIIKKDEESGKYGADNWILVIDRIQNDGPVFKILEVLEDTLYKEINIENLPENTNNELRRKTIKVKLKIIDRKNRHDIPIDQVYTLRGKMEED